MGVQISDDIARYRKMLSASKDETEQQIIFKLLNEEIAKQKQKGEKDLLTLSTNHFNRANCGALD